MTCQKEFQITIDVAGSAQMWWTLDNPAPDLNVDSVSGDLVNFTEFGAGAKSAVPAIISNGVEITTGVVIFNQAGSSLDYAGVGFSMCFWMQRTPASSGDGFIYQWNGTVPHFLSWDSDGNILMDMAGPFAFAPAAIGVWAFYCFAYDQTTQELKASIDGAAFTSFGAVGAAGLVNDNPFVQFGNNGAIFDEIALFPLALSQVQKDFLYNGGAGRTFPVTLPP